MATDETSSNKSSDPLGEPSSPPPAALANPDNPADNLNHKKPEVETPAKLDDPAANPKPEEEISATKAHWVPTPHWKERLDFFNKGLQIIALVLGALWAVSVFFMTIVPGLEPKVNAVGDISWTRIPDTDLCMARFDLSVKNPGPNAVSIDSAELDVWTQNLSDQNDVITGDSLSSLTAGKTMIIQNKNFTDPPVLESSEIEPLTTDIVTPYPPGMENSSSQLLIFKDIPKTFVFIRVTVKGSGHKFWFSMPKEITNYGYSIDQICGSSLPQQASKRTNPSRGGS